MPELIQTFHCSALQEALELLQNLQINVLVNHFFRLLITDQHIVLSMPPIYNEEDILSISLHY